MALAHLLEATPPPFHSFIHESRKAEETESVENFLKNGVRIGRKLEILETKRLGKFTLEK